MADKLIGTKGNQVPSNSDLGTAAFADTKEFLLAKGAKLSAIDAIIDATAQDIFVYDTSDDTDGGAWRKRVQHTSWYKENLNTEIRGSRRDFPAVAICVLYGNSTPAEGQTPDMIIYDGDDPDFPMWMEFRFAISGSGSTNTSISACNGKIVFGRTNNGILLIDMIIDRMTIYNHVHRHRYYDIFPSRLGRTATRTNIVDLSVTGYSLPSEYINDVDIAVLPGKTSNIDESGLPVPHIAVAHNSGVSIMKPRSNGDDFQVVDLTHSWAKAFFVKFTSDGRLLYQNGNANTQGQMRLTSVPDSDDAVGSGDETTGVRLLGGTQSYAGGTRPYLFDYTSGKYMAHHVEGKRYALSGGKRFVQLYLEESDITSSMVTYIDQTKNTGWMPGDTKTAISDSVSGLAEGYEKITNGDFSNGTTGWTAMGNGASISESGGQLTVTSSTSQIWNGGYQGLSNLIPGRTYVGYATIVSSTNWGSINISAGAGSAFKYGSYSSWNGGSTFPMQARFEFTATNTTATLQIDNLNTSSGTVTVVDNVELRLAEADATVNARSPSIYGTLRKTKVAPGADLVGWSGFEDGSNRFGANCMRSLHTVDYGNVNATIAIMGWQRISDMSNYSYMGSIFDSGHNRIVGLSINSSASGGSVGIPYLYDNVNGGLNADIRVDDGDWHFIVAVLDGTSKKIYIDGKLRVTYSVTGLNLSTVDQTNVGHYTSNGTLVQYSHKGEISNVRFSKTIPTAEQVAYMYHDERPMYKDNAKSTLRGDSIEAVATLDVDRSSDTIVLGTPTQGGSAFQGLTRVDDWIENSTSSTSITNGLRVEE
jgi:trimeric autotransporter adhesin